MFEKAVRQKLRFNYKGICTVEDLWDLSLEELDSVYKTLQSEKKKHSEVSLLNERNKEEDTLQLKIDVVSHIFNVLKNEKDLREVRKERKEKKQKILDIIARKQEADLENKSIDELNALVNEL